MYKSKKVDSKGRKGVYDIKEAEERELIDTLWNVKSTVEYGGSGKVSQINRYIMEDKDI